MNASEKMKRTKAYRQIKASLMEQLERSGNDRPHYIDLVEDYMKLYVIKELCARDIDERGVVIRGVGSTGQKVEKRNDSVDMMQKTNQQMIKLLDSLGIKPEGDFGTDEDM